MNTREELLVALERALLQQDSQPEEFARAAEELGVSREAFYRALSQVRDEADTRLRLQRRRRAAWGLVAWGGLFAGFSQFLIEALNARSTARFDAACVAVAFSLSVGVWILTVLVKTFRRA
jgi:hypothetical protein